MFFTNYLKRVCCLAVALVALLLPASLWAQADAPRPTGDGGRVQPFTQRADGGLRLPQPVRPFVKRPAPSAPAVRTAGRAAAARPAKAMRAAATQSPATLFGCLIANDDWGWSADDKKYGLYSLDPNTGAYTEIAPISEFNDCNGGGTYANGKFYVSLMEEFYGYIYDLKLVEIDVATGQKQVYDMDQVHTNSAVNMTYDAVNDVIYSVNLGEGGEGYTLDTFDPATRTFTVVAPMESSYYGLCVDGSGQMYVVDDNGDVCLFDKATGQKGEVLVTTGFTPRYLQSCCWSPLDRKIYWAASNDSESELIVIDPATRTFSTQLTFVKGEEWVGLYSTDPYADPHAPAAATDLAFKYSAPGAATAELSCQLPALAVDGSALTSPLTAEVRVDGEVAYREHGLSAGSPFKAMLTLTEGIHTVTVVCTNDAGEGLSANVQTYTGADMPGGPTGLAVDIDATGRAVLTWQAPESGQHGGWIDTAKLRYSVSRNGALLATGLTDCSYTDQLRTDSLAGYVYTVTATSGGVEAGAAQSDLLVFGEAVKLPYAQPFDDASAFNLLTVVDNNHDGVTWKFDESNNSAVYTYSASLPADEYLALPAMKLRAGHVYKLTFEATSGSASYPERLGIVFGPEATAAALTTVVMEPTEVAQSSEARIFDVTYVPQADVTGHFAFHCTSEADRYSLNLDNVRVEELGSTHSPLAVTDLAVTPDADGAQRATLAFTAPTHDYSGAALTSLSAIEIRRNGRLIHTITSPAPGSSQRYTDAAADFGFNTYAVRAVAGDNVGASAEHTVFLGIYGLPYEVQPTAQEYSLFTVIDNNQDDNTWYYDISDGSLKYGYSSRNAADDYAITAPIELGTANLIEVTFDAMVGSMSQLERVAVTYGQSPEAAAQTDAQVFDLTAKTYTTYKAIFEVPAPGRYYIGFRALSAANQFTINVKNIRVRNGAVMRAPAAVSGLEVTPAARGELTATARFTLPTARLDGTQLDGTLSAVVTDADGREVGRTEGRQPGESVTLSGLATVQGDNAFTVETANDFGRGGTASATFYSGIDVPGPVTGVSVRPTADNLQAELAWEAPATAVHNGYFDPAQLTYTVYQYTTGGSYVALGTTTERQFTATPRSTQLDLYTFVVTASSAGGEGAATGTDVMLGTPLSLPYEDNFPNSVMSTSPWVTEPLEGNAQWGLSAYIRSLDLRPDDGGMLVCHTADGQTGTARMHMPKVNLGGLNAPTLAFSVYHVDGGSSASLSVKVTADGVNYDEVLLVDMAEADEPEGWTLYKVNLAAYKDKPWVGIVFDGTVNALGEYVILDDFSIQNDSRYDAAITGLSGPRHPEAGTEATYRVTVSNKGSEAVMYGVEFSVDGQLVGAVVSDGALAKGATAQYDFRFTPTAEQIGREVPLTVRVVPAGWTDELPDNNRVEATVAVTQPALPVVTDLAAVTEGGAVSLSWTQPSLVPPVVTDDFEEYESFAYEHIGDYTLIDGDGLTPCGIMGVKFPHMGEPMAFQVWEPMADGVNVDASIWRPYSGQKCLVAWASLSQTELPYNDDYLISPEVVGGTEVSFYAAMPVAQYTPETFEVMYSTTTTDAEAFTALSREQLSRPGWTKFTYQLPADARYFAIHYISQDKFALLVDDLSYVPLSEAGSLQVTGYNVYRDGVKLNAQPLSAPAYTDSPAAAASYQVTVVYDRGESSLSNTVRTGVPTGLSGAQADGVRVTPGAGVITVTGAAGQAVRLYTAAGQQLAARTAGAAETFRVPEGVYVVRVAGSSHKVRVAAQ